MTTNTDTETEPTTLAAFTDGQPAGTDDDRDDDDDVDVAREAGGDVTPADNAVAIGDLIEQVAALTDAVGTLVDRDDDPDAPAESEHSYDSTNPDGMFQ